MKNVDIEGSVRLGVKSLRSRAAVNEELRKLQLPENGTVVQLKTRLANDLKRILDNLNRKDFVNLDPYSPKVV